MIRSNPCHALEARAADFNVLIARAFNYEAHATDLKRWFEAIRARPAMVCANEKGRALNTKPVVDEKSRTILFGQRAQTVRKSPG